MALGKRISQYRKGLGISQEELGARLGVSRQAVSKWETGTAAPDMENLLALAREFGVSVAELTGTPEAKEKPVSKWRYYIPLALVLAAMVGLLFWLYGLEHRNEVKGPPPSPPDADTEDALPAPSSDFALILDWTESGAFLELGEQESDFPFGTPLCLDGEETTVTADDGSTVHTLDCLRSGGIRLRYSSIEEEGQPPRTVITLLEATLTKEVSTPRGIHVGSSKAEVVGNYGGDLVYCVKEEGGDLLTEHDYYYAYQPKDACANSICFFMKDTTVQGIRVENMADLGNDAYTVNNISIFPIQKNGDPDYSNRMDLYMEPISETRKVYIAWNQLVTNNNLSAEELYTDRWTIFSTLSNLDWWAFGDLGTTEHRDETISSFLTWLREQAPYSEAEIFRLQMGVQSNLDGWLADSYSSLLSGAFFSDPTSFVKGLAYPSLEDTMLEVIHLTAYDAEWHPVELEAALETLDNALNGGQFTEAEVGWARLLRLYLITPIDERNELPKTPAELQ